MKKILFILVLIITVVVLQASPLTLFFTNDTHGAYLPNTYKTAEGNLVLGGYENLYNLIKAQRDTLANSLWLDAGDQQTGSAFSSLVHKKAVGGAVVEAFNKMGLDAATLGNHEFDQSYANTRRLVKLAKYPFLSANLIDRKSGKPFTNKPYKIFKRNGLKIGVMGLTLTELPEKVKTENVASLEILPYKQAVDMYLEELDSKTDLIILLTHNGIEADSLLATQLDNRIDLIVGGHSHSMTSPPKAVNGIYIVQTGAFLIYYGRLDLEVEQDRIVNDLTDTECLFPVVETKSDKQSAFHRFFRQQVNRIDKNMSRVIGYTEVDWIPDKYKETAVSEWQAEALLAEYKDKYHPDIAMINCGGIRKAIPAGPITIRDMTEMLPFTNYVVIFSCKASDLVALDNMNKKNRIEKPYDIIQTTMPLVKTFVGAREITLPDGSVDMEVGGSILDPDKIYRVVSHDYVVGQWEKYLGFKPFDVIVTSDTITDVMIRQVEKQLGKKKL
jgi:2',3'-cyclic-nucleotide 2'-phosphodiesterase (5'-nucleotidase family)